MAGERDRRRRLRTGHQDSSRHRAPSRGATTPQRAAAGFGTGYGVQS